MAQLKITNTERARPATASDVVAAANAGDQIFRFHKEHGRFPTKEELQFFAEHQRFPSEAELSRFNAH
ncbi:MAG: hypothetical protein CMI01_15000 [Oceanospirillaceae bacterium]|nr:hypothetical protein [Oceanospirillaceae bacterium]